jgi:hypothetical protein
MSANRIKIDQLFANLEATPVIDEPTYGAAAPSPTRAPPSPACIVPWLRRHAHENAESGKSSAVEGVRINIE